MRLLDVFRASSQKIEEQATLHSLHTRLLQAGEKRESLLSCLPVSELAGAIVDFEGIFSPPPILPQPDPAQTVLLTKLYQVLLSLRDTGQAEDALRQLLKPLSDLIPQQSQGEDYGLTVSILDRLHNPIRLIDTIVKWALTSPFPRLQDTVQLNLLLASGIDPTRPSRKMPVFPADAKTEAPGEVLEEYLKGTPFIEFFRTPQPFAIPVRARFEHCHIVGGSGHGKTQLLQHLQLMDLDKLRAGQGCIIVLDSQGDMLRTITHLAEFAPSHPESLADRLVLIDPNDIEHPPALNLFDFGLDRLERYTPVEREKLINGAIALYEYLFGALLGAELTQRQGVIFRYIARLMMTVPGGTIHTLMQFMEDPEATRPHLEKVDRITRHFFETQFYSKNFDDTRQQILTRLWGVISNSVLERMFSNEKNKLDLFDAMNRGSIILINTAKDLLKQEGCEILGRFFIALICQAAQERASIAEDRRRATFLYIDEAHDYFDESIENLFNQARKYKVGIIIAHQNLDQFEQRLRSTVMASTSIKLDGGLSAKDATAFAKDMRCEPEFLQAMRKRQEHTEFACYVRNHTEQPVALRVPFGRMEGRPRLTDAEYEELLARNRARYGAGGEAPTGMRQTASRKGGFALEKPELF